MRTLTTLILLTSLALFGCPSKKQNGETPTVKDTTALAESSETPEATTEEATPEPTTVAKVDAASYHIYDNGTRCITFPCPSWSAVSDEGKETKFTDVDLSALNLTQDKITALQAKLAAGHMVTGSMVKGPTGPAGEGTTLKITSLGKPKAKPAEGK